MPVSLISEYISNFSTVLLGIFIEALSFLLLGTLFSGLVEVFIRREDLVRYIPRNVVLATLFGACLGLVFPVCECGVIPLTRRLYAKGLPISAGIAFLLAAPIVNPVVLASTFAAYGWGIMFAARAILGLVVACAVGLFFSLHRQPDHMMLPQAHPTFSGNSGEVIPLTAAEPVSMKLRRALRVAGEEFFEMGRYLLLGSSLAALLQTFVPQQSLLAIGSGPVTSVLTMQVLAYILSVCSTVDAFLSLAFIHTFTLGSVLSFLVFGPMVDVKSTLMYLGVFKPKFVVYLVLFPFLIVLLVGIFINLNLPW